jgi:hypothetical protein
MAHPDLSFRRSLIATLIVRKPAAIALMVVLPAPIRRL